MMIRKGAALLVALGLTLGLLGAGVGASFSDGATAGQNINVGTFGIEISSTVAGAQVSQDKHSVSFTAAQISSSAPGQFAFPFTVKSIGSMPVAVHITQTTPTDPFVSTLLDPVADIALNQNATHDYLGGLRWPMLVNDDLQKVATITYKASARELAQAGPLAPTATPQGSCGASDGGITIPVVNGVGYLVGGNPSTGGFHQLNPGPYAVTATADPGFELIGNPAGGWNLTVSAAVCNISFVGAVSANSSSVSLPAGWQPGDMAIVMATNPTTNIAPTNPVGWNSVQTVTTTGSAILASRLGSRVLQAGDTATGSWTSATRVEVLVYRNVAGLGGSASYAQSTNVTWLQVPAVTMQVTNGTSWVASLGACKPTTGSCRGAYFGNGITVVTRTSGAASQYMLGADTNGGVSTWAPHASSAIGNGLANGFSVELKRAP